MNFFSKTFKPGGPRLVLVVFSVLGGLFCIYGYLVIRSLLWSPSFYIKNYTSKKSKVKNLRLLFLISPLRRKIKLTMKVYQTLKRGGFCSITEVA